MRVLLGTRHQCAHQQVERSPIARQAVKVSALYIYLVQDTSAISGVSCLAPTSMRKNDKCWKLIFLKIYVYVQIALASKFVSPYHHKCAKNIYKVLL